MMVIGNIVHISCKETLLNAPILYLFETEERHAYNYFEWIAQMAPYKLFSTCL